MATNQFDYIVILNQSNTTSYLLFVGIYDQYLKVKKLFIIIFFSSKCKAYVIQYWYSINGKLWSLNPFSLETVFIRQNLTSVDVKFCRIKTALTLKELKCYRLGRPITSGIQMNR